MLPLALLAASIPLPTPSVNTETLAKDLYVAKSFLTDAEAASLAAKLASFPDEAWLAGEAIRSTGRSKLWLYVADVPVLEEVLARYAALWGLDEIRMLPHHGGMTDRLAERVQAVRYVPGYPGFDLHTDSTDTTAVLYLNDIPPRFGGELEFPLVNVSVTPTAGKLAFWASDRSTEHHLRAEQHRVRPMTSGSPYRYTISFLMNITTRSGASHAAPVSTSEEPVLSEKKVGVLKHLLYLDPQEAPTPRNQVQHAVSRRLLMADGGEGAEHAHGPAHTHALGCNFTPDPADPTKHTHALGCNFTPDPFDPAKHTHALGCNFIPDPADPAKHTHALGCNFIPEHTHTHTHTLGCNFIPCCSETAAHTHARTIIGNSDTHHHISSLPAMPPRPAIPPAERRKGDAVQPEQRAWLPCTRSNSSKNTSINKHND